MPAAPRTLTREQVEAIRRAMATFVEEDLTQGGTRLTPRWCIRCDAHRPGAGFITYDGGDLCHPCAVDYELARTCGRVRALSEFLHA
jgi:hypothetical protein